MNIDSWLNRTQKLKASESTSYMDRRRAKLPPTGTLSRVAEKRVRAQREPQDLHLKGLGIEDAPASNGIVN